MKKMQCCVSLLFSALVLSQIDLVGQTAGAQQAIAKKADCKQVGGKITTNIYSTGEYPYLCTYPDKYDRQCQRQLDETAYYDVAQRKCVSELACDINGDC